MNTTTPKPKGESNDLKSKSRKVINSMRNPSILSLRTIITALNFIIERKRGKARDQRNSKKTAPDLSLINTFLMGQSKAP